MTDALTQIARDERERKQLIKEGKLIKCPICWKSINNNKEKLIKHINYYHTYNEIMDKYTDLWVEIWNSDTNKIKSFFSRD
jgi:hypothetical protein